MLGKTHLVGGLLTGELLFIANSSIIATQNPSQRFLFGATVCACSIIGSLFPDIDHKNSIISKKNPVLSFFARIFSSHRGFFHSPIIYIAVYLILFGFFLKTNLYIGLISTAFLSGTFSHIILDFLNPMGVPLLFPFSKKKYHAWLCMKTGSFAEKIIRSALGLSCIIIPMCYFLAIPK